MSSIIFLRMEIKKADALRHYPQFFPMISWEKEKEMEMEILQQCKLSFFFRKKCTCAFNRYQISIQNENTDFEQL